MSMHVRTATLRDAAAIAGIYAHYVVHSPATFEETPPTAEQMARRIGDVLGQFPFYVAEVEGSVAGYTYASSHHVRGSFRWVVDTAIYVAHDRHRSGIGRALYGQLLPTLRQQGYVKAYASITLPNEGSVGLHEAMGFRRFAVFASTGFKLGQWRDVGWWQYMLEPSPPNPPPEPIPFPELHSAS